ncbi:MAG: MFS transporter, partial [Clostridia bacterium]|nr:MFS transporter [Clostridia bacterium]
LSFLGVEAYCDYFFTGQSTNFYYRGNYDVLTECYNQMLFWLAVPLMLENRKIHSFAYLGLLLVPFSPWGCIGIIPLMLCIGVVTFLVIFLSTFFYKEKVTTVGDEPVNIFKSVAACFKNRSFIIFEVLSFTVIFIQTILMQGVIYYFDEFDMPMPIAYGVLGVGAVFGVVLWSVKVKTWGVKRCTLLMCVIFAVGAAATAVFGKNNIVAGIGFFAAGMGFAGGMFLIPLMNGDVIDYDETVTGQRREGMYAGVNSLITKPAISFANSAFIMISKAFGYNTELAAGLQSETAKQGILVAWMAIPAAMLVICAIAMRFYPLYGEKWDEKKRELEKLHKTV